MNTFKNRVYVCLFLLFVSGVVDAAIIRDPIGVNVPVSRGMSLTVRFADNTGTPFTTTEALFCFRQLDNGQCDPAAILGRLPANRDRGSTTIPTTSITDVMTIPYSVIRSATVIAGGVNFSDFFYIRRFTPAPGEDLGAGVDVDVFQKVTCHLAGPATEPLSMTVVSLYGKETNVDEPVFLLRLDEDNLSTGQVMAHVTHTGTGILEGWWEVRRPGDAPLQEIDLLPAAALSQEERALQHQFHRIKRFRVLATTTGTVEIPGPLYSELPSDVSGRHEVLLRFDATQGRENRARLEVQGEPNSLFSGAVAGFAILPLEYQISSDIGGIEENSKLFGRLKRLNAQDGGGWQLIWKPTLDPTLILAFTMGEGNASKTIIAPALDGVLNIADSWMDYSFGPNMTVFLKNAKGEVLTNPEPVTMQQ